MYCSKLHKKLKIWVDHLGIVIIPAVLCFTCVEQEVVINPSDFKIYVNNSQNFDAVASDILPIGASDLLVFGVCGSSPADKFEGDSSVYFRKLDAFGKTQWDSCFAIAGGLGFPSNLIKLNEQTVAVFWNRIPNMEQEFFRFSFDDTGITAVQQTENGINCNFDCGAIMFAQQSLEDSNFDVLGVGFDPISSQSTTFVGNFDPILGSNEASSQRTFIAENFGGVGANDFNLLQNIDNFLFLQEINGRLLVSGPLGNKMTLVHVGELVPIYQDEVFWVSAVQALADQPDRAAVVLSSPGRPDNPSYLIPDLNLEGLPSKIDFKLARANSQSQEIFNLDVDSRILIHQLQGREELIIVGTSRTGQPIIYTFNGAALSSKELGDISRFELGAIAQLGDGSDLVLVGTTKIENRRQRIFTIKIRINEVL